MPLSKERDRNRKWWERRIAQQPWWDNADAETMAAAKEAYAEELSGRVPPVPPTKPRLYKKTMERT